MDLKVFKLAANTKNHKLLKDYDYVLRQKNTFCGDEVTISIKATTTDHLGFIGEGKGIACQAIATLIVNR